MIFDKCLDIKQFSKGIIYLINLNAIRNALNEYDLRLYKDLSAFAVNKYLEIINIFFIL